MNMLEITGGILLAVLICIVACVILGYVGKVLFLHQVSGFWPWTRRDRF